MPVHSPSGGVVRPTPSVMKGISFSRACVCPHAPPRLAEPAAVCRRLSRRGVPRKVRSHPRAAPFEAGLAQGAWTNAPCRFPGNTSRRLESDAHSMLLSKGAHLTTSGCPLCAAPLEPDGARPAVLAIVRGRKGFRLRRIRPGAHDARSAARALRRPRGGWSVQSLQSFLMNAHVCRLCRCPLAGRIRSPGSLSRRKPISESS